MFVGIYECRTDDRLAVHRGGRELGRVGHATTSAMVTTSDPAGIRASMLPAAGSRSAPPGAGGLGRGRPRHLGGGAAKHHRERSDNREHDHDDDDRQDATGTPSGKATTIGAAVLFERDEQMPLMRNPEIPKKTSSPMNPDSPAWPSTAVARAAVARAAEPPSVFAHGLRCGEPNTRAPAGHPSQYDHRQACGWADDIDAQRAVESTQRARAIPGQA